MRSIFLGGINHTSPESPGSSISFSSRLKSSGFQLISNPSDAEFAVCVDNEKAFNYAVYSAGISREKSILIRNEPVVVCPENKASRIRRRFGLILNMGRSPLNYEKVLPWPQSWPVSSVHFEQSSRTIGRIALVNGNKISFIDGELYSLRRKAIKLLENLDLYGTSWDMSFNAKLKHAISNLWIAVKGGYFPRFSGLILYFRKYPNWRGAPENKIEVLSKYKYCLVIENSCEFMTEKLFDALFAGCIPVYVGPDLTDFPIPSILYLQAEPNIESIKAKVQQALSMDYLGWSSDAAKWLNLEETRNYWSSDSVNNQVIEEIRKYYDSTI